MTESVSASPKGLGGWLILVMLVLVIRPVYIGHVLATDHWPIFRDGTWSELTTVGTAAYHHLWAPILIFEIIGNVGSIVLAVVTLVFLLKRSRHTPRFAIVFFALTSSFVVVDFFAARLIPAVAAQADPDSIKDLVHSLVSAAIWIPYFLLSKRVKATFRATNASSADMVMQPDGPREERMEGDVTLYRALSPTMRVLMVTIPLVAIGIGAVAWMAPRHVGIFANDPVLVFFLTLGVFCAYGVFRAAHTIVLREIDASVEFRTFFGVRLVPVAQIVSVLPVTVGSGPLILKHTHGSVLIAVSFTGLHDVLEWIRRKNPNVIFKGI